MIYTSFFIDFIYSYTSSGSLYLLTWMRIAYYLLQPKLPQNESFGIPQCFLKCKSTAKRFSMYGNVRTSCIFADLRYILLAFLCSLLRYSSIQTTCYLYFPSSCFQSFNPNPSKSTHKHSQDVMQGKGQGCAFTVRIYAFTYTHTVGVN